MLSMHAIAMYECNKYSLKNTKNETGINKINDIFKVDNFSLNKPISSLMERVKNISESLHLVGRHVYYVWDHEMFGIFEK